MSRNRVSLVDARGAHVADGLERMSLEASALGVPRRCSSWCVHPTLWRLRPCSAADCSWLECAGPVYEPLLGPQKPNCFHRQQRSPKTDRHDNAWRRYTHQQCSDPALRCRDACNREQMRGSFSISWLVFDFLGFAMFHDGGPESRIQCCEPRAEDSSDVQNFFDNHESFLERESFRNGQECRAFVLMVLYPRCTDTEVLADGDRGAHPINTLAILALPPRKACALAAQRSKSMTDTTRWLRGGP